MQTHATIHLASVSYQIDSVGIIPKIDLTCEAGRIGIIGRNGSGKSTLARILTGLIPPTTGEVKINTINITKDRKNAIRTVGILFQNPDHQIIFPTVIEEIIFGLRQLGATKKDAEHKAMSILAEFDKTNWRDAPITALSQGQRHLVCLMAVIAMEPKLLILDEPFAGLDLPTKMQLARALSAQNTGIMHITHDARDLEGYDEVIWLDEGRIRLRGNVDEVLRHYETEMTRLGASDDLSDISR